MKVKIITGFRENQYFVIDAEEAHKAYYLFLHPEERGVFNNGVALIGKNIQGIEPAFNETMGWNPTHKLGDDDWNELKSKGIAEKLNNTLFEAKQVAQLEKPETMMKPLSEVKRLLLGVRM